MSSSPFAFLVSSSSIFFLTSSYHANFCVSALDANPFARLWSLRCYSGAQKLNSISVAIQAENRADSKGTSHQDRFPGNTLNARSMEISLTHRQGLFYIQPIQFYILYNTTQNQR